MPKKHGNKEKPGSRMVNVGIAPGNEDRLRNYIQWHNRHPSRNRPVITATDIINEALDIFLSKAWGEPDRTARAEGANKAKA